MDGVIAMKNHIQPRMMRMRQLTEYTALSRAYIYQKINEGSFPPGHMISSGIRVWETESVNEWVDKRLGRA
jgi:predicted DNA-binding transcriptional regulator AlpA